MEKENVSIACDGNKWISVLAYFIFFLPLVVEKDSEFGKFHANQALNLLLLAIAVSVVGSIIPPYRLVVDSTTRFNFMYGTWNYWHC